MENNTKLATQLTFKVYRDGELDIAHLRRKQAERVLLQTKKYAHNFSRNFGIAFTAWIKNIE